MLSSELHACMIIMSDVRNSLTFSSAQHIYADNETVLQSIHLNQSANCCLLASNV